MARFIRFTLLMKNFNEKWIAINTSARDLPESHSVAFFGSINRRILTNARVNDRIVSL